MCIIIFDNRKSTERLDRIIFERSLDKNPDGVGIMWPWRDKLRVWRTMASNTNGVWDRYTNARARGLPVAVHFRKTTKGTTKHDNLHPFRVRPTLGFMHNGTIHSLSKLLPEGISDSSHINTEFFQRLPIDFMKSPTLRQVIAEVLFGDRMLFMDGFGDFTIFNENKWGAKWEDGVWYSKGQHLPYILDGRTSYVGDGSVTTIGSGQGWDGSAGYGGTGYGHGVFGDDDDKKDTNSVVPFQAKSTTKPKKLTKAERRAARKALKNEAKGKAVVGPQPAPTANLVFDYGFLRRIGYEDYRLKLVGKATLKNWQLWAVGDHGSERPAAFPMEGCFVKGDIYQIQDDFESVLNALDMRYGCELKSPEASVYHRRYREITLTNSLTGGIKYASLQAWVYRHAIPLSQISRSALVPFGDWVNFEANEPEPLTDVGTLVVDKIDINGSYKCPLCTSKKTQPVLMWMDKHDYILHCDNCDGDSIVIEREAEHVISTDTKSK